ncbi:hypothetical protein SAMN05421642_11573 [Rhodococcoides kyotonense]|uniref:Uncharacterized protein n=1 Tax=Rhodococcoides kyotonense TaxID=398843 RepID=A0A239M0R1_9NOCA|nr:hypothetical protein SAMN05421642_11573 [Rhodococcus kyotonensis]
MTDLSSAHRTYSLQGSGLLLASMDVAPECEEEFNKWYWEEHFPERMACPGFQWGARFQAVEGSPRYLALYVLDDPQVLETPEYRKIASPSPWTRRILPETSNLTRAVYRTISPSNKQQNP